MILSICTALAEWDSPPLGSRSLSDNHGHFLPNECKNHEYLEHTILFTFWLQIIIIPLISSTSVQGMSHTYLHLSTWLVMENGMQCPVYTVDCIPAIGLLSWLGLWEAIYRKSEFSRMHVDGHLESTKISSTIVPRVSMHSKVLYHNPGHLPDVLGIYLLCAKTVYKISG